MVVANTYSNTENVIISMRRLLSIFSILAVSASVFAQNAVYYWFDRQTERNVLSGTEISTAGLTTGLHFAYFQIASSDGLLSPVKSTAFLVMNEQLTPSTDAATVKLWFDKQSTKQDVATGTSEIDCSSLATGVHLAYFQIVGTDGMVGPVQSKMFVVMNEQLGPTSAYSGINYWFDQQTVKRAYTSGDIDCSTLSNGIHAVHFQLIDSKGLPCPVKTQFFVNLDFAAHQLYYWFDNETTRNLMAIDGTEISVADLANGPHTLHAMLADAKGNVLSAEVQDADFTIICSDDDHVDAYADGTCDVCHELITYTRSGLTEGNYGTLCLPKGGAATGATIYSVVGKRVDAEGNPTSLVLEEVTVLEPGKPYMFCATGDELKVKYTGFDFSADALSENGLIGNYTAEADVDEGYYLLHENKLVKCGSGCKINANRAYLDMSQVSEYGGISHAPTRAIYIDGNDALGIGLIEWSDEKAQIITPSGMRIPRSTKGLMIINGNKVIKQ